MTRIRASLSPQDDYGNIDMAVTSRESFLLVSYPHVRLDFWVSKYFPVTPHRDRINHTREQQILVHGSRMRTI